MKELRNRIYTTRGIKPVTNKLSSLHIHHVCHGQSQDINSWS